MIKILVSYPRAWLRKNNPIDLADVAAFYENLFAVLDDRDDVAYEITDRIKSRLPNPGIHLSHHTCYPEPRVWNIKKGYVSGYLYFDRTGYSGWAEIANSKSMYETALQAKSSAVHEWYDAFTGEFRRRAETKIKQSESSFDVDEPYVFVALQRPHDTVAQLSRIPTYTLAAMVADAFRGTDYRVVVKAHPLERAATAKLKQARGAIITNASIHKILPRASAVYTVNSGVGLEALLYGKRVFAAGHSDYHWVTTAITNMADVKNSVEWVGNPDPGELRNIMAFVHYLFREYYVPAGDRDAIARKIETAIRESEL